MGAAYFQFGHAFFNLHQFDTPASVFIFISLCLFLPFWGLGALMLRACLQRVRLAIWVHQAIKIATYNTPLTPAEAGFLVDYEYSYRELTATLLDLHFRHVIVLDIETATTTIHITLPTRPNTGLSSYEQTLCAAIADSGQNQFVTFRDPRLIEITLPAHEMLINELTYKYMIQRRHLPSKVLRKFFRIVYFITGAVGLITTYAIIFQRAQTLAIGYPRYAVHFSELFVLIVVGLIVVGIITSGYWPRLVRDYKDPQYEAWMDAAGFMLYLRTVFIDRFSAQDIASQDQTTLRIYSAYAVAYGIIPSTTGRIAQLLSISSQIA